MKEWVDIFFRAGSGDEGKQRIEYILSRAGCPELIPEKPLSILDKHNWLFSQTLDANDLRLQTLLSILQSEGIKTTKRLKYEYSDAELYLFPLLDLRLDCNSLESSGPELGTIYDLSKACSRCGAGAVQLSPLMVPLAGFPKKGLIFTGAHSEILVAEGVGKALELSHVTGIELRQVRFYRNHEPLPWWQIITSYEMPKIDPRTCGIITDEVDHVREDGMVIRAMPPCPLCSRDGRYDDGNIPTEIYYRRGEADPEAVPDIVHTWECFGRSGWYPNEPKKCRFAPPLILVKPKVFDVFRRLKVKQARFNPVRFI